MATLTELETKDQLGILLFFVWCKKSSAKEVTFEQTFKVL